MPEGFDPTVPAAAPANVPAAAPAPSAAPTTAPTPSPASAAPALTGPAPTSAPTGDAGVPAELRQLAAILGDPTDLKSSLEFLRTFRRDVERAREQQQANDPDRQAAARRGATFRSLMEEGYGREHVDALRQLPELVEAQSMQRTEHAKQELSAILSGELSLDFPQTPEGRGALQEWEDTVADILNRDPTLNRAYFNPTTRRDAILKAVEREETRINRVLLAQNAATIRDAAKRRAVPSAGRYVPSTVTAREEMPKAPYSDPAGRRREHAAIASRQMNDILSQFGM